MLVVDHGELQLYDNTVWLLVSPHPQDQFDTIDFSDNEIRKLEGFPLLQRLKSILMSNNKVW